MKHQHLTSTDTHLISTVRTAMLLAESQSTFIRAWRVEAYTAMECVVGVRISGRWIEVIGAYRSPNPSISNLRAFIDEDLDEIVGSRTRNHAII